MLDTLRARTVLFHWWFDLNGDYCEDGYLANGSDPYWDYYQ
jgi:hypothetical protein